LSLEHAPSSQRTTGRALGLTTPSTCSISRRTSPSSELYVAHARERGLSDEEVSRVVATPLRSWVADDANALPSKRRRSAAAMW